MLSRVAQHLYWLGRYIERAENTARLVSVNINLLLDLPKGSATGWRPLLEITGAVDTYLATHKDFSERSVLNFLLQGKHNPCALLPCLLIARENCRAAQDSVPRETWEHLNRLYWFAKEEVQSGLGKKSRHQYFEQLIMGTQGIFGLLYNTLTRDAGYHFIQIGCLLERADMTSRLVMIRSLAEIPEAGEKSLANHHLQWMSILKSLTAYQMYCKSMQIRVRRADVLYFLLKHATFPRAIYGTLQQLLVHSRTLRGREKTEAEYHLESVSQWLAQIDCENMDDQYLFRVMQLLQYRLGDIHLCIEQAYFPETHSK